MRTMARNLVLGGALLAVASTANAQTTTLYDTLGNGLNLGQSTLAGPVIGYDAGASSSGNFVPSNQITSAGYAVLPFTVSGSGSVAVSSVQLEAQLASAIDPNATSLNQNSFYGAFVQVPNLAPGQHLGGSSVVGGFFQFLNTDGSAINVSENLNQNRILNGSLASLATPITLQGGSSYFLVLAPKAGFGTQPGDLIEEYIHLTNASAATLANAGGSTALAGMEDRTQYEKGGANAGTPGDVLQNAPQVGGGAGAGYAFVRILGTSSAAVPETSTVATALLGLAPVGGLLLRRRRRAK